MSHFSKIKTSITNVDILKTTIEDLGLKYQIIDNEECSLIPTNQNLFVYDLNVTNNKVPVMTFEWSIKEYTMVVDLELWNLNADFNHFADRLFQQYAYNVVVKHGSNGGFHKIKEDLINDGSIKVVFQKF